MPPTSEIAPSVSTRWAGFFNRRWQKISTVAWCVAPLVAFAVCFSARGATIVWLGASGGNANIWNRKQNWNPQGIPTANDTAQFDDTSTAGNLSPSIGVTNTSVGAISFISGTTFAYNISGTATLTVGSATVSGITNSSATNQQFSVSTLALGINQSWTAGSTGNLSFSSAVSLGTRTLTLTGSSTGIGNISGLISGTGAIVKSGTGIWALSGANTFSGTTTVSQGTLQIDSNAPSGSAGALGNATSAVTLNDAGTGANNTALLIGTDGVTIGRTITGANAGTGTTSLGGNLTSGVGTFSGAITLNKSASLTADGTSNVTFSSVIGGTGAGITKTGIGTVTLSGSNTYTGATTISQGTLQLNANAPSGAAGTLGNASSAVNINDSNTSANNTALMIGANGVTVARDINVVNFGTGVTTLGGNITSGSGTFSGGVTLNKSAALNADGTSTIDFTGVVSGTGNITKTGDGTVTLGGSGANLFLGTATVNAGTLALAKTGGALAINGNIIIGDGSGTDTVRLDGANQIASTSTVTLNDSGGTPTLNLNGYSQTLGSISSANTGAQVLLGSPGSATTLTVGDASSTTFAGVISGGNNAALTKTGTGSVTLSGANIYAGATNITSGVVSVQNNSGLGATTTGTFVTSGAELQLSGGLTIGGEALSINGAGGGGTAGALNNVAGSNTFGGVVTIASASTIKNSAAGTTLTLSGGTSSANNALTIAGAGNTTISGNIANGTGTLTKAGSGTLTFSGATGTVGTTALNAGAISVGGSSVLNTGAFSSVAGTTLTIASGGSVAANYSGGTTYFSGAMAGAGEFQKTGAGTLVFDTTFTASSLTLTLNGGTLSLLGGQFAFGTIHITGNTILDFNNSAGTFLSSANLVIDAGVTVTVNNWTSVANNAALSTVWYATNTINAGTLGGVDIVGGTPLSQVAFTNYGGLTTTWVSGNHGGWFDHEIRPTPEPSTYGAILLTGCLGLIGWRRFRGRKSKLA
ncbi:MAG: autotransporter-associated beta strand repeat-containing protein [Opitutaceae bacterium]|nr:autotransporter-associated beta strand repeat-containing protein [Opitutaceae bacterium]